MKEDPNANQGRGPLPKRAGFRDIVMAIVYAICAGLIVLVVLVATGAIR